MATTSLERTEDYQRIRKNKGREISKQFSKPELNNEVDYFKVIKIEVAWSGAFSKNVILGRGTQGKRYFLKQVAKDLKRDIHFLIRSELAKHKIKFINDKVYLDIFVQKPNAGSGDAINVIDLIADGVSEAIGVDDRWFSIKSLDWAVIKDDPKIFIEVGQSDDIVKKICSYCGRILPLDKFNKNKSQKDGRARICRECIKI